MLCFGGEMTGVSKTPKLAGDGERLRLAVVWMARQLSWILFGARNWTGRLGAARI